MCIYIITDSKGNYIRKDNNRYVSVRSEKKAFKWQKQQTAENILLSSLSKKLRTGYKVVPIEDDITPKSASDKVISNAPIASGNGNSIWEEKLQELASFSNDVQNRFVELNDMLSNVDKKITDAQHYIEFNNLNACEGWKCFDTLQHLLRERRQVKNEIEIVQRFMGHGFCRNNIAQLSQEIEASKNKRYTPRALPELFSTDNIMSLNV